MLSHVPRAQGGVYLLENGAVALLHIDRSAPSQLVEALTGAPSHDDLQKVPGGVVLARSDAPASRALQDLL
eukprot:149779-Chlamydomonas_euryale.AAC.1